MARQPEDFYRGTLYNGAEKRWAVTHTTSLAQRQLELEKKPHKPLELAQIIETEKEINPDGRFGLYKIKGAEIYVFNFENPYDSDLIDTRPYILLEHPDRALHNDFSLFQRMKALICVGSAVVGDGFDYSLADVAQFLNLAKEKGIALNPMEQLMEKQLLDLGLLSLKDGKYVAVRSAAIIGGREIRSPAVFQHELNHGIYMTDSNYRAQVNRFYRARTPAEHSLFKESAKDIYDLKDEELVAREFVAFFRDCPELKSRYLEFRNEEIKQQVAEIELWSSQSAQKKNQS